MLLITNDRELLDTVCDRVLYLEDTRLRTFTGGLTECMATISAERQAKRQAEQAAKAAARAKAAPAASSKPKQAPDKIRNPMKFQELEERIMGLEEELEEVRGAMTEEANYTDHQKLQSLQEREKAVQAELAQAYETWENWQ